MLKILKIKKISKPITYNVIVSVNAAHDVVPDISLGYPQNADITKVQCRLIICQNLCDGVQTWNIQTGSHTNYLLQDFRRFFKSKNLIILDAGPTLTNDGLCSVLIEEIWTYWIVQVTVAPWNAIQYNFHQEDNYGKIITGVCWKMWQTNLGCWQQT